MWNSQKPLNLLMSMPETLDKDNLIRLQKVIDIDKMTNSRTYGRDLCGEYAPFCEYCNKKVQYPCAQAYVKMKQAEGFNVQVDETLKGEEPVKPVEVVVTVTEPEVVVEPQPEETVEEIATVIDKKEEPTEPVKIERIRIAYLKRK
ncbi:MAG: hypothetical protein K2K80_06485 [Clostridia bacterium]|nr:hypothetical protein [Clostridia bacterium]